MIKLNGWRNLSEKQIKNIAADKKGQIKINSIPLEEEEQKKLVEYLNYRFSVLDWCHVPNEGQHKVQYYAKQKKLGVKSGVPDILIFRAPKQYNGIAIELKRIKGGKVSKTQKEWLARLKANGWLTKVARGADDAIEFLEELVA